MARYPRVDGPQDCVIVRAGFANPSCKHLHEEEKTSSLVSGEGRFSRSEYFSQMIWPWSVKASEPCLEPSRTWRSLLMSRRPTMLCAPFKRFGLTWC